MLGISFNTSGEGAYLYHSGTNRILRIDDATIAELECRPNGDDPLQAPGTETALALWEGGFLDELRPFEVSAISCERTFRAKATHEIELFVLELTQRCTLQCSYCVYSDWYPHRRTHGALDMSMETALWAVDYYFDHNYRSSRRSIGFYGGEPLLKFDMFPEIMRYARQKEGGEDTAFHMTTNGLLMDERVADFCMQESISLTFSLDGPKEDHDRYRSTPEGRGSFDNIMHVCKYMKEKDPAYYGLNVGFNAVYTPSADLEKLESFFNDATGHELVRGQRLRLNYADPSAYGVSDWERSTSLSAQHEDMKRRYIQMLIDGTVLEDSNSFVRQMVESPYLRLYKRPYFESFGEIVHRCGMCLPAVRKTYVDIRGGLHVCERAPESFCFGSLDDEFDLETRREVSRWFDASIGDRCKTCWAIRLCGGCVATMASSPDEEIQNLDSFCTRERNSWAERLVNFVSVLEQTPSAFDYMENISLS